VSMLQSDPQVASVFLDRTPIVDAELRSGTRLKLSAPRHGAPVGYLIGYLHVMGTPDMSWLEAFARSALPPLDAWRSYEWGFDMTTAETAQRAWDLFGIRLWPGREFGCGFHTVRAVVTQGCGIGVRLAHACGAVIDLVVAAKGRTEPGFAMAIGPVQLRASGNKAREVIGPLVEELRRRS
jgi:hypothetical protein